MKSLCNILTNQLTFLGGYRFSEVNDKRLFERNVSFSKDNIFKKQNARDDVLFKK